MLSNFEVEVVVSATPSALTSRNRADIDPLLARRCKQYLQLHHLRHILLQCDRTAHRSLKRIDP